MIIGWSATINGSRSGTTWAPGQGCCTRSTLWHEYTDLATAIPKSTVEQVFSPTRVVAQLLLIACGVGPRTVLPPGFVLPGRTVLDHVDLASILIDSLAWDDAPADLLVWSLRLKQLRPRILTATAPPS